MSNKPNPVAETACLLMQLRFIDDRPAECLPEIGNPVRYFADLASRLHRIAPAAQRLSEAQCNGDFNHSDDNAEYEYDCGDCSIGDRHDRPGSGEYWAKVWKRTNRALTKLASELKPLGIRLSWGGDPRGACLTLHYGDKREYYISAKGF